MLPPCDCTLQVKSPGRREERGTAAAQNSAAAAPLARLVACLSTNTQVPSQVNQNQSKSFSHFAATFLRNTPITVGLLPTGKNTPTSVRMCVEIWGRMTTIDSGSRRRRPSATFSPLLCVFIFFSLPPFLFTSLAFISLIGLTGQSGSSSS